MKLKLDVNFKPSIQHQFLKELIHDKLSDEEIVDLRTAPEIHIDKLAPFRIEDVKPWLQDDNIYLWLVVKDPELVMLEMEKPELYQKLKDLALGREEILPDDVKSVTAQIKAIESVLKLLDKSSSSKKQKQPPKNEAALEAKLLKALPKQYSRLSDFELEIARKQSKQLCNDL